MLNSWARLLKHPYSKELLKTEVDIHVTVHGDLEIIHSYVRNIYEIGSNRKKDYLIKIIVRYHQ